MANDTTCVCVCVCEHARVRVCMHTLEIAYIRTYIHFMGL